MREISIKGGSGGGGGGSGKVKARFVGVRFLCSSAGRLCNCYSTSKGIYKRRKFYLHDRITSKRLSVGCSLIVFRVGRFACRKMQ